MEQRDDEVCTANNPTLAQYGRDNEFAIRREYGEENSVVGAIGQVLNTGLSFLRLGVGKKTSYYRRPRHDYKKLRPLVTHSYFVDVSYELRRDGWGDGINRLDCTPIVLPVLYTRLLIVTVGTLDMT